MLIPGGAASEAGGGSCSVSALQPGEVKRVALVL